MITNIYYIHSFPFTKEAFIRDEFEYLNSKGYNVKFLDIANLIKKKNFEKGYSSFLLENIIPFNSKSSFSVFLNTHKDNSLIITNVGLLSKTAWVYLSIFKAKLPYVLFENPTLQRMNDSKGLHINSTKTKRFIKRLSFSKVLQKPKEIFQYLSARYKAYSPELIITSKDKLDAEKRALKLKNTKICFTSSMDYQKTQSLNSERIISAPYAVFVDQYFIHHPDFQSNHITHSFTANQYYSELNIYLQNFAKQTNLKIIIAAHPRRLKEEESDFSNNFKICYNQTAELIKYSKVVLLHFSTAINFAVIFKKPVILCDSALFHNSNIADEINMIAKEIKQPTCQMSDIEGFKIPIVNIQVYQSFLENYITHPKADGKTFKDYLKEVLYSLK